MIRAKPHQQQPPRPARCEYCNDQFNNAVRLKHHIDTVHRCTKHGQISCVECADPGQESK